MSITLNMVGGGGGKLKDTDAVLAVTVPTGSSVTMTKGAVTLTPTIWTTNADNTLDVAIFPVPASTFDSNAWTVTATLNGDTASDTIVINSAEEYEMALAYNLYLFHNGAYGIPLDYVRSYQSATYSASMTISNNLLDIYLKYLSGSYGAVLQYGAASAVDVTDYSTLVLVIDSDTGWCNSSLGIYTSKSGNYNEGTYVNVGNINISGTHTLDISNISGNMYPALRLWTGTGNEKHIYISDWYLER